MKKVMNQSFEGQHLFVGVDVHLKSWAVTVRWRQMEITTVSMNPSPEKLYQFMTERFPGGVYHSVYEAGFCGFSIHRRLQELGFDSIIAHPADVPTRDKERNQKRDKVDSRKLARELESGSLKGIYIPDEFHQQLRSLCRLRERLVRHATRLKNRIKSYLAMHGLVIPEHTEMPHWSNRFLSWLDQVELPHAAGQRYLEHCLEELRFNRGQITRVLRELRQFAVAAKELLRRLQTVSGVGFVAAITFYTEIIDMRRFCNLDQLAAFIGLVPSVNSSGENERCAGITSRRHPYLRYLIIEAAWVAVRKDPALTERFAQLVRRMKKQDAIIRIAKDLLARIRHVWLKEEDYVIGVAA